MYEFDLKFEMKVFAEYFCKESISQMKVDISLKV